MPVTSISKDPVALTMTIVADFPVPVQRLWEAYADPRQLERFWGPPTYPATFTRHDVYVGGLSAYLMTGPEGDQPHGYWEWLAVDAPNSFEVLDGFAQPDGTPDPDLPRMRMVFAFQETADGARLTTTTYFQSAAELEQLMRMGLEEGARQAMGQIEAVLEDLADFATGSPTNTQLLSDTQVRVSRVVRGPVELVWRAHHEPDLLQQWLLGPDGWSMPVCEVGDEVGSSYRYEWESADGANRFGFTGSVLESEPPRRSVTTEQMIGTDGPVTRNELTMTPLAQGTLLSLVITYPSAEVRDSILATGMTDGMEASYTRLEGSLPPGV